MNRRFKIHRFAGAAAALILALAWMMPAVADTITVVDADDSAGVLDLVYAQHREAPTGAKMLIVKVATYEEWESDTLGFDSGNRISIEFNRDADDTIERCLVVHHDAEQDTLVANMFARCDYREGERFVGASEAVRRPDTHSVSVKFRASLLGRRARWESYRWRSTSNYESTGGSECPTTDDPFGTCADFSRWARHRL